MKTPSYLGLEGLRKLTDATGMLQHAKFSLIDRKKGYTTDDNSRALIAALRHHGIYGGSESLELARTYLMFLLYMQKSDGSFHNKLGFDRRYLDEVGSEDCMGNVLWATGYTLASDAPGDMKKLAKEIFDRGLPRSRGFTSPRAKAFTILGLSNYHYAFPDDPNIPKDSERFADSLIRQYGVEADDNWPWFEAYLTYANPRIPQALFSAYESIKREAYYKVAKESLDFLVETEFEDGIFQPVGTNGWYKKRGKKATYDQQPLEASCMVEAAVSAFNATGEPSYRGVALDAFAWYHGKNIQKTPLIDPESNTCYDGITPEGVNQNQGAESTVSYYLAYLKLKEYQII